MREHTLPVTKLVSLLALTGLSSITTAQNPTPVLDRFSYSLSSNLVIDLSNKIISVDSNMTHCEQENGSPPLDTVPVALHTNNQFIGLQNFKYNLHSNSFHFISETVDLFCDNGVFVDTLFVSGFQSIEQSTAY